MYKLSAVEAATRSLVMFGKQLARNNLEGYAPNDAITLRQLATKQAGAQLATVSDKPFYARFCMVNLLVTEQLAQDAIGALIEHDSEAYFVVNMVHELLTEVQPALNKLVTFYMGAQNVIVPTIHEFASAWSELEYFDEDETFADDGEHNAHFPLAFDSMTAFTYHMSAYDALCEQIDLSDEKLANAQSCAVGLLIAIESAYIMAQHLSPYAVNPVFNKAVQDVADNVIVCLHKHFDYLNNSDNGQSLLEYIEQMRELLPVYS